MKTLTVTYDVTNLTEDEVDLLIGEATVQAEETDGDWDADLQEFVGGKQSCRCLDAEVRVEDKCHADLDLLMEDENGNDLPKEEWLPMLRRQFPYCDFELLREETPWNGFPEFRVTSSRSLLEKFLNAPEIGDLEDWLELIVVDQEVEV